MAGTKKEYDLICSLGGNCAAAHNLQCRNMRKYSLPFDWCFAKNERAIEYLSEGFKDNFKNFALKENFEEITEDGYAGVHDKKVPYSDKYSGYYFLNHFNTSINEKGCYENFYTKLRRRINRLQEKIKNGKKILFILSTTNEFNTDCIQKLQATLKTIYPNKQFDFVVISFSCSQDETYNINENITVYKYKRAQNEYDFIKTNFEWAFLDNIRLSTRNSEQFSLKLRNKTLCIYLFTRMSTLFRINLYVFGLRLDFCIGKVRDKDK